MPVHHGKTSTCMGPVSRVRNEGADQESKLGKGEFINMGAFSFEIKFNTLAAT